MIEHIDHGLGFKTMIVSIPVSMIVDFNIISCLNFYTLKFHFTQFNLGIKYFVGYYSIKRVNHDL